jgi:hypothetical protein
VSLRGIEAFREWVNDLVPDGSRPDERIINVPGTEPLVCVHYTHTEEYPGPIDVLDIQ